MRRGHNLAPADRLAQVREEIKTLQAEEDALREGFINGDLDPNGTDYVVALAPIRKQRLDLAALKREFGLAQLRPFISIREELHVRTLRRVARKRARRRV